MTERATRQITDARVLSALAHPLRTRLLELFSVDGPATASMLAERTGQAVGNISHHLHVLAKCELIVEAPELARDRRERWWTRPATAIAWSSKDFADDAASEALALTASSINLDRHERHARAWLEVGTEERASWGEGPFSTDTWARLTPGELAQCGAEIREVLRRWADDRPDDGQERASVFLVARGTPARP
ncbi:MAG: helix-turn-helix domain-containing protein [Jatrophihabitantaceae bacterium]